MLTAQSPSYEYKVGGSLPLNAPSYVRRQADEELYRALKNSEFCYILNSRQMGKSSLRVQTMHRLRQAGIRCESIDLTLIGTQQVTPEQWYASLVGFLAHSFRLKVNVRSWWRDRNHLSLINRLSEFLQTVLLGEIEQNIVIFIDEIDAVGRERGAGIGGGNDEREQTLNQLLTEMDGFKENKGVIVVGATNRVDILDAALLRPGRFDRQITVNLPDRLGRIGILKVHARNKPFAEDVSLVQLANRTPGFSGADLANLLNEAAILATRYKKKTITKNEVNEAADRIIGGIAGTVMEDTKNKKLIAYHEVGHAIVGSVLENHDEVEKITLIPRGGAKGLTWFTPEEDQTLLSRSQLLARIITTLAGRVTEQVVFGDPEVTTGASNDLQQVTNIARQMVTRYGMSNIGPIALEDDNNEQMFLGGEYNEAIADRIDTEVCKIINHCEQIATEIVLDNRVVIDLIVEKLLDTETIDGDEFRSLLSNYTILPAKK